MGNVTNLGVGSVWKAFIEEVLIPPEKRTLF